MTDWTPKAEGVIPAPQPKPSAGAGGTAPNVPGASAAANPATVDTGAPTPEQAARRVAAEQEKINAKKRERGEEVLVEPTATPEPEPDPVSVGKTETKGPGGVFNPATGVTEYPAGPEPREPAPPPAPIPVQAAPAPPVAVTPPAPAPAAAPKIAPAPPVAQTAPVYKRQPKHRMGASLKIPGGFTGNVVMIYPDYKSACDDPDVIAAGGISQVLRGRQGTGVPSTTEQPFYRVRTNARDYDLVVGELDAHLIRQGPE